MLDELRTLLESNGANMVGIADLHDIARDVWDNYPIGVSIAVALNPQIIAEIRNGPTKQYFEEYKRANMLLDILGHRAASFLIEHGYKAVCLATTSLGINPRTLSTRLPHKTTATRAGLGWIGKCALLVTKKFGSAVRITTVLTDAQLPTNHPVDAVLCGKCTACVDACPAHAVSGKDWRIDLRRDAFYDPFACRKAAIKQMVKNTGIRETLCGICIAVCPWTQKYVEK